MTVYCFVSKKRGVLIFFSNLSFVQEIFERHTFRIITYNNLTDKLICLLLLSEGYIAGGKTSWKRRHALGYKLHFFHLEDRRISLLEL